MINFLVKAISIQGCRKIALTVFALMFVCYQGFSQNPTVDTININNIQTVITPYGNLFWNFSENYYQQASVDSNASSIYNSTIWMGGIDNGGQLHMAAETYAQNSTDFWPGPLDGNANVNQSTSDNWEKIWSVSQSDIQAFCNDIADNGQLDNPVPQSILDWPAKGNPHATDSAGNSLTINQEAAPFVDVDNNGVYNPYKGDYPAIKGDQMYWWVYNDALATHGETGGNQIGAEIQVSMYGFDCPQDSLLNNTLFFEYQIKKKSTDTLNNFLIGSWTDFDLGCFNDDFVGSDTFTNSYYAYNGDAIDENCAMKGYGQKPPVQVVSILQKGHSPPNPFEQMGSFMYYNNDFSVTGNPKEAAHYHNYLDAKWKDSSDVTWGGNGYGGSQPWPYMFPSSPDDTSANAWSECKAGNTPSDRRGVAGSKAMTVKGDTTVHFSVAYITVFNGKQNGCAAEFPQSEVQHVRSMFNNEFSNTPCAPSKPCTDSVIAAVHDQPLTDKQIEVYPNPAGKSILIKHDLTRLRKVTIYNAKGQVVRNVKTADKQEKIGVDDLTPGVYILRLRGDNTTGTQRFVKSP
jgi:hypothetical protein